MALNRIQRQAVVAQLAVHGVTATRVASGAAEEGDCFFKHSPWQKWLLGEVADRDAVLANPGRAQSRGRAIRVEDRRDLVRLATGHDPMGHLFGIERLARAARAEWREEQRRLEHERRGP